MTCLHQLIKFANMQLAYRHDERPSESLEVLDGTKTCGRPCLKFWTSLFVLIRAEVDLKRQVDALRVNTMIFTALQSYEVGFSSNSLNFQIQFYFRFVKRPGEPSGVGRKKSSHTRLDFIYFLCQRLEWRVMRPRVQVSPYSIACCISMNYLIKAVTLSIFTEGGLQK